MVFIVYHWILTVEFLSLPSNSTNCMEFTQSLPLQIFMHLHTVITDEQKREHHDLTSLHFCLL